MKNTENLKINILTILFSVLPISIIAGASFSLVNIVLFSSCFTIIYFSKNDKKIYDFKPVLLLFILYLYLILNSLISIDITSGIYRNLGFIRFIPFFLMVNYIFFISGKNSIISNLESKKKLSKLLKKQGLQKNNFPNTLITQAILIPRCGILFKKSVRSLRLTQKSWIPKRLKPQKKDLRKSGYSHKRVGSNAYFLFLLTVFIPEIERGSEYQNARYKIRHINAH